MTINQDEMMGNQRQKHDFNNLYKTIAISFEQPKIKRSVNIDRLITFLIFAIRDESFIHDNNDKIIIEDILNSLYDKKSGISLLDFQDTKIIEIIGHWLIFDFRLYDTLCNLYFRQYPPQPRFLSNPFHSS